MFGARKSRDGAAGGAAAVPSRPGRRTVLIAAGVLLLAAAGAGVGWALATGRIGSAAAASASVSSRHAHPAASARPAPPLRVVSLTPAHHARHVDGADPVTIVFSAPLAAGSPMPAIRPAIAGTWSRAQGDALVFTPATGFGEDSLVTVHVPAGPSGVRSAKGGLLAQPVTLQFRTHWYSTLRLQELLAQLGYLPLSWSPAGTSPAAGDAAAQLAAAYQAPPGTFSWDGNYPGTLTSLWAQGSPNLIDVGAIRAFEADQGLTMDGVAGPAVWRHLLRAAAAGQDNPNGYTYALASKASPETLTVWHDGQVVLRSFANTGIPEAPTADGTFPVFERLPFQIMKGTNPDGTKYADPVENVAYFDAGEAVHYFPRASYGWPQSLGCVELPLAQSAVAYRYLTYGSLVTVAP